MDNWRVSYGIGVIMDFHSSVVVGNAVLHKFYITTHLIIFRLYEAFFVEGPNDKYYRSSKI